MMLQKTPLQMVHMASKPVAVMQRRPTAESQSTACKHHILYCSANTIQQLLNGVLPIVMTTLDSTPSRKPDMHADAQEDEIATKLAAVTAIDA